MPSLINTLMPHQTRRAMSAIAARTARQRHLARCHAARCHPNATQERSWRRNLPGSGVVAATWLIASAWPQPAFGSVPPPRAAFEVRAPIESETGYFPLRWKGASALGDTPADSSKERIAVEAEEFQEFQVESALDSTFEKPVQVYAGPLRETYISGLRDGQYHYRVRARQAGDSAWGPWSTTETATVHHHSLGLALTLFVVGALVFTATASFVFVHGRREPTV